MPPSSFFHIFPSMLLPLTNWLPLVPSPLGLFVKWGCNWVCKSAAALLIPRFFDTPCGHQGELFQMVGAICFHARLDGGGSRQGGVSVMSGHVYTICSRRDIPFQKWWSKTNPTWMLICKGYFFQNWRRLNFNWDKLLDMCVVILLVLEHKKGTFSKTDPLL